MKKTTDLEVSDIRFSFMRTETVNHIIDGNTPAPAFSFLTRDDKYAERFEAVQKQSAAALGLQPPWTSRSHRFWKFYLPGAALGTIGGAHAWKAHVPLRSKVADLSVTSALGNCSLEAYFYRHGVGVIVTLRTEQAFASADLDELVKKIWRTASFSVELPGAVSQTVTLGVLMGQCLDKLRAAVIPGAPEGRRRETFSVVTVVKGKGVDPDGKIKEKGTIHTAINKLTGPTTGSAGLPKISAASLPLKGEPRAGNLVYSRPTGRVVWFPSLFTEEESGLLSLSCYHRNLVLATLQTESLGSLIAETVGRLQAGKQLGDLTSIHRSCARHAAEKIADLYMGNTQRTYRSSSIREQIRVHDLDNLYDVAKALNIKLDLPPKGSTPQTPSN